MARPSGYSKRIALKVAEAISEGASMHKIARDEGMPTMRTMLRWIQNRPEFGHLISQAKHNLATYYAEQSVEISDEQVATPADAARQRNRIAARQWMASRLDPRKYSERLGVGQAPELDPVEVRMTENEVARRIAYVFQKALRARDAKKDAQAA